MNNPTWNVVAELTSKQIPLSEGMRKLQVALHRLNAKEAGEWVGRELEGYKPHEEVPEYRVVESRVIGTFIAGGWQLERPIFLQAVIGEAAKKWDHPPMPAGVEELERLSGSELLQVARGPQLLNLYNEELNHFLVTETPFGRSHANCIAVRIEVAGSEALGVLSAIRQKALKMALELEGVDSRIMSPDPGEANEAVQNSGTILQGVAKRCLDTIVQTAIQVATRGALGG